ncbi:hypothetical protein ELBR111191_01010 [Elizabethkingia bruuniana]
MYGFKKLQLQKEVRNGKVVFLIFCYSATLQIHKKTTLRFHNFTIH